MALSPVWAQIENPALPHLSYDEGISDFSDMISTVITLLFVGGIMAAFLHLIVGGYRWISAKGDKAALQEAQQTILNSVVGLVILFAVYAILNLLGLAFEINLIKPIIPSITGT